MPCNSSTRRKRVGSTARSTGRVIRLYQDRQPPSSTPSSPIRLLGVAFRASRIADDDRSKFDIEHYARMAEAVIESAAESIGKPLINPEMERPDYCEAELVERFLSDAARLSRSYVRLLSWLQQAGNRHPGVTGGKRGSERIPRRPLT